MQRTVVDDETLRSNWPVVVRTVSVSSVMVGTLGAALHRFLDVATVPLVFGAAATGLMLGLRLPAAAPPRRERYPALTPGEHS
jgi:hypothetical protein